MADDSLDDMTPAEISIYLENMVGLINLLFKIQLKRLLVSHYNF